MWGEGGTELVLVRHAEPYDCGPDPGLTELGHRQAAAMAEVIGAESFGAMYVSAQMRAQETAAPLASALGIDPIIDERITEFDYGDERYISPRAARNMPPEVIEPLIARMRSPEFTGRVTEAVVDIVAAHAEQRTVVVCHGVVIGTMVRHLTHSPKLRTRAKHTSVVRLRRTEDDGWELQAINESHWLQGLPPS